VDAPLALTLDSGTDGASECLLLVDEVRGRRASSGTAEASDSTRASEKLAVRLLRPECRLTTSAGAAGLAVAGDFSGRPPESSLAFWSGDIGGVRLGADTEEEAAGGSVFPCWKELATLGGRL
jgi:hypothetical protein